MTGAPASSYELALTDETSSSRSCGAATSPSTGGSAWGWTGTAEFLYNRDVNGIYYINANLPAPQIDASSAPTPVRGGPQRATRHRHTYQPERPERHRAEEPERWARRGTSRSSAERPLTNGLWLKTAYSYGEAKNTVDPGSIAFGSWNNNQHPGDPNNPGVGYSSGLAGSPRSSPPRRTRKEYFKLRRHDRVGLLGEPHDRQRQLHYSPAT